MTSKFTIEQLNAISSYRQEHKLGYVLTDDAVFSIMKKDMGDKIGELYPCFASLDPNRTQTDFLGSGIFTFEINPTSRCKGLTLEVQDESPQKPRQPVVQPIELTEEQAKNLTIQYLSEDVQNAIEIIRRQDAGWVTDGYDSIKEFFDAELSEKNVGEVLNGQIDGIGYLQKAQEGTLTRKDYYEQNKLRLKEMIMKRVFEKDEKSGIDFIDLYRGNLSRKEFEKLLDSIIQRRINEIPTMAGIKSMQHSLIMMDDAQTDDFLENLYKMFQKELQKEVPLESNVKFIKGMTVQNDYDTLEPMTFEEVYKLERGTEFSEELLEELAQKKGELNVATGAFNKYNQFATAAGQMLDAYSDATRPVSSGGMYGTVYVPPEPDANKRLNELISLYQNYYANSPDTNAAKKNLELAIKKSGLPIIVLQNEHNQISLDMAAFPGDKDKNRAINTILRFGQQEQKATLDKILGGKDIDTYIKAHEKANTAAMGTVSSSELAKAMEDDNYTAIQVYSGGVSMAGMGLMVIGGVTGCVPLVGFGGKVALTGMAAKNILGFTDALSRDHVQSKEVKELSKALAMDLAGFAIGGYAGQKGTQIASNLLSKGYSPWVALVAEKSTDFSLSLAGDLAMMGVLQSSDTAGSLTEGNVIGIIVSTFTGIQASKQMFREAELQHQAIAVTPDGRQVAVNPADFAMQIETSSRGGGETPHIADNPSVVSQEISHKPDTKTNFVQQEQRLKELLKDEQNLSNDYYRSILSVLKKFPDNAEFILDKLESSKFSRRNIINFIVYGGYNPELKQSNIILEAMSLSGKYSFISNKDIEAMLEMEPEKLAKALEIVKTCKAENENADIINSFKALAEADIADVGEFTNFIASISKLNGLNEDTMKGFINISPEKRSLLVEFVNNYEKTKESTGALKNDLFSFGNKSLSVRNLLNIAQFEPDKIAALRDIYTIGSDSGENIYNYESLNALFNCSTEQIRMIEKFAQIRNSKGKYEFSSSGSIEALADYPLEKLEKLFELTLIKGSENEALYDSSDVLRFAKCPDDKLDLMFEFAKLKVKGLDKKEYSVYEFDFNELAAVEREKLEMLLELAQMKKDGELIFNYSDSLLSLCNQSSEKLREIVEFMRNHPDADKYEISKLRRKTLEQLQVLNGKTIDTSKLDPKQLELEENFNNVFEENSMLDAEIIREACTKTDGTLDEGAIKILMDLAPEQRYNFGGRGTDFIINAVKSFRNADGIVDIARYQKLKTLIQDYCTKVPLLQEDTNMTFDAMYSLARRSGEDADKAIEQALNFISTINNPDIAYDALSIVKDLDGGVNELKNIIDKYSENIAAGRISRKDLNKYKELSMLSGEKEGLSSARFLGLLNFAETVNNYSEFSRSIQSLNPEAIDDSGKIFEFAQGLKNIFADNNYNIYDILENQKTVPRQIDIEALKMLSETYSNNKIYSWDVTILLKGLNDINFSVFTKILEKFNGKNDITFGFTSVPAQDNYIPIKDLQNFMAEIKTQEDAELVSFILDSNKGISYSQYGHNMELPDAANIINNAKKYPNLTNWIKSYNIEDGVNLLIHDWDSSRIEGYISQMNAEQRNFSAQLAAIKNPNDQQLLHIGTVNDSHFEIFKNIPPEKYDSVLQLGAKLYDASTLFTVLKDLTPEQTAKFTEFIDKGFAPDKYDEIIQILRSEKIFGNKEVYDKLLAQIDSVETYSMNIETIRDIVCHPYNEKGFNYIMDNLKNEDFVTPEALINYISLDPNNIDNLEYLKTSSNLIATPEFLSEILAGMDKSKMIVFNEMVNELKTHNDNFSYDMENLSKMMRSNEDMDSATALNFQKLYRMYDENGNHIIPATSLFDLAKNNEIAEKILGQRASDVKKLNLTDYKVPEGAVKNLAENMPDEFKVILYNNNGEFTEKEYLDLLKKLNENEYLRDALAEFEQTGTINLNVFSNKEVALALLNNDPQLLGIIKSSPELIHNNPGSVKQNLYMVNELLDEQLNRYKDFVTTNPGLLPPTVTVESFLKEIDKYIHGEEQSAMMFKLANIYGAKNIKTCIAKMDPKTFDSGLGILLQYSETDFAPLFTKIFAMKDVGEAEFELIMRVANFTDTRGTHSYGNTDDVKLLEQDFGEILEKIAANGKFDKQAFFEDVYQGLLSANVRGFDPMTPDQLKIIADSDFISNPNIKPQDWAEFTKFAPEVRKIISSLLENSSFDNIKKILSLSDDNSNALAGMSFSDKMKMLDIVDSIKKEDIDALEKAGYNINNAIMKVVKALSLEKKFIQTSPAKQQAFLKGIIANNNPRAEYLLKNTDFTTEEFANGIPLKYPRSKFVFDIEKAMAGLTPVEQSNVLKYFDIYKTEQGFEGIPVIPKNSEIKLSEAEKAAADKLAGFIEEFTTKNEAMVKEPELKSLLDSLVQGLPEFTTIVGKAQHGTHAYTVDIHTLKVLQYAMNEPGYDKLSDKDKTILKLSALVHDFGKKEGVVDEGHAVLSSEHVNGILAKFNMPDSIKYRIIELVNNHHWFAAYNKGEMSSETMAALCRNPEDFEISKILAKADLLGVNDEFYLRVTNTANREEFDTFTADKFSYIDKKLTELRQKANIILDTQILNSGAKFPVVKTSISGEETELPVLNLTDENITDLAPYGFAPGTTKDNARFTVHMTPNELLAQESTPMNTFNILSATPTHHSVQSTSLISFNNNRTYGHRKFGFILDVDQSNISTANPGNVGSGTSKTLDDFTHRLFESYSDRTWVKSEFQKALKRKNIEISEEQYGTLAKYLYSKKYGTQIYSEYVNENASPEMISGNTGFTKELYAEYVSPKTTPERKAEIFDLCVASKTYVIRQDGTVGIEYASRTGGNVPDDGALRIKAKDLRDALESSRDELFQGLEHSEIVSMTPRVRGLIARVSRIEDCPQAFLKFAKENKLPIILIGYRNPAGVKN